MNDMKQGRDDGNVLMPIVGFALGAVVGAGIALLLAPASGEHTRRRLSSAARRLSRDTRNNLIDARDSVTDAASGLGVDVKAAIQAGREAFKHDGEPHEGRTASRSGHSSTSRTP